MNKYTSVEFSKKLLRLLSKAVIKRDTSAINTYLIEYNMHNKD